MVFGIRLAGALRLRRPLERAAVLLRVPRTQATHPGPPPALPIVSGRPDSATWTNVEMIPTVTDVAVAFVGEKQRPPAAVLKVAKTPMGSRDLHAQRDVLSKLGADSRLAEEWRKLLPRILEFCDDRNGSLSVETFQPAVDLTTALERSPDSFEPLTNVALATISELHHRTGTVEVVDDGHLEQWVNEPLTDLTEMCQVMAPKMLPTVERLGEVLRGALANRHVLVSWTHGDFTPGNVRLASERGQVTGVIDWGTVARRGCRLDRRRLACDDGAAAANETEITGRLGSRVRCHRAALRAASADRRSAGRAERALYALRL